jgi:hypothetical protein
MARSGPNNDFPLFMSACELNLGVLILTIPIDGYGERQ